MGFHISADEARRIMIDYVPTIGNKLRKIILFGTMWPVINIMKDVSKGRLGKLDDKPALEEVIDFATT